MKKMGVLGCGDFLRWQAEFLCRSKQVTVTKLFDPDQSRAQGYAPIFDASPVESAEAIFNDDEIDLVALFVPPWVRKDLFFKACDAGKHIITTKPLGTYVTDCHAMADIATAHDIKAAVIYSRTDDAFVETVKQVLDDGAFGKLALYRQDWIHAYPQWNNWATDPEKNGGPFMDAMIHNLNAACYLMGRPVEQAQMFSDKLAHPDLRCADTESMVVHFAGGVAHLFITWAADLATYGTQGNDREHIDLYYLVTDKGWRITRESRDGKTCIVASRHGKQEIIPVTALKQTAYDAFASHIDGSVFPSVLASLSDATRDIEMVRNTSSCAVCA